MDYNQVQWERASCGGTDTRFWYADSEAGFVSGESKGININLRRICKNCDILNDCATYAIEHEMFGFWAGMAENERRMVRNGKKNIRFVA